jgi:hypothetical protein
MSLRLAALAAILPAFLLGACVTAIPVHQGMPLEARSQVASTDVIVPIAQAEIDLSFQPSNMTTMMGGGLLWALIDAGVDSSNSTSAQTAIGPLRTALVDFNFDETLAIDLGTAISESQWLKAAKPRVVKDASGANIESTLNNSSASSVLLVYANYQLTPNADEMLITLSPRLVPRTDGLKAQLGKVDPKQSPLALEQSLYRSVLTFRGAAPDMTDNREKNLEIWAAENAAQARSVLKLGSAKLSRMLADDLQADPVPFDPKTTKLEQIKGGDLAGYLFRKEDGGSVILNPDGTQVYVTELALAPLKSTKPLPKPKRNSR